MTGKRQLATAARRHSIYGGDHGHATGFYLIAKLLATRRNFKRAFFIQAG